MVDKSSTPDARAIAAPAPGISYLEWGAVLAGATVASALSVVLFQFGSGVGLALTSPTLEDGSASWNVVIVGLWTLLVAISSAAAGGYIAGRMRSRWGDAVESEVEFRDGVHGLVVWGASTLAVAAVLAIMTALATVGIATTANVVAATPDPAVVRLSTNITTLLAFATAAGAALGAGAAWFSAISGGKHRDEATSFHVLVPGMFRAK